MYKIPELSKYPNLFHAFSEKKDGNMANVILGEDRSPKIVLGNRKKFVNSLNLDIHKFICMWVGHTDKVVIADTKDMGRSMENKKYAVRSDGLITNKKGVYLFLLVADCLPLIFYDPEKSVVGVVHSGWRGVDLNITDKAVKKMIGKFGSNPEDIVVGIGPAARKDSYIKKGSEIEMKEDMKWKDFLIKKNKDEYKIDFVSLCKKQLLDSGIKRENIFDCGVDTIIDRRFFSHFRDRKKSRRDEGRFACLVGLQS